MNRYLKTGIVCRLLLTPLAASLQCASVALAAGVQALEKELERN